MESSGLAWQATVETIKASSTDTQFEMPFRVVLCLLLASVCAFSSAQSHSEYSWNVIKNVLVLGFSKLIDQSVKTACTDQDKKDVL
ncbi:hypothetical protein L596_008907 [Steinernema carpocapsae]|uniref:Uncharacterized protein n=1 Tax=Steinernema carpocapsae TaxID=34508 RepID=A0A4U5PE58_STECR|nr:hypothetical protein L596_008907 [Steinernema carpocapsae]